MEMYVAGWHSSEDSIDLFDVKALATGYADALIQILARPWGNTPAYDPGDWDPEGCPHCKGWVTLNSHDVGCAWLIAARATGISD